MTESERLFSETPVLRLFLTAAIPGAVGMILQSGYELVDGVFVGRFVGETAFAAINLAMPFVIIIFAFGDLIGIGSAVPISIAHGKGERAQANNIFTCACLMNVVFGLACGIVFLILAPHIMGLMGAEGELSVQATLYLRVYAAFLPLTTICYAADNYLKICGKIRRSMWCNAMLAASGAALEFYLLGVLHLGVGASALSFSVAMVVASVLSLWPFIRGEADLAFTKPHFSLALIAEIVRDGMPVFLQNVVGRVASIVLNVALLALGGEDAVSIFGVAMFTDGVIVPLIYGTVDALQPAVGFNWGAKNLGRVRALERCCFTASVTLSLVYVVVVTCFPREITLFFMPAADAAFLKEATFAVRVFALSHLLRWLPFATQAYMVAVGQSRLAVIVSVGQSFVCPMVALALLWPLGILGLWLNMAVSSLAAAVLAAFVLQSFRRSARLRMDEA